MKSKFLFPLMVLSVQLVISQNYLVSFEGTGASASFDSINVENLTKETFTKLYTGDTLLLMGTTGILDEIDTTGELLLFPNPASGNTILSFTVKEAGNVSVTITDASGSPIIQTNGELKKGLHKYQLSDLKKGSYIISISGLGFQYSSKLICQNQTQRIPRIVYLNDYSNPMIYYKNSVLPNQSKSIINMDYTYGDRLLFKAYSGNYCTIVTDVLTESKTITFEFVECVDYDGNHYAVVHIGGQTWMAESLKTTHYRNGTLIPNIIDNSEWTQQDSGAYCWYNNDIGHKDIYGALYNWYAVADTNNIAPFGWHVPTKDEIHELTGAPSGGYSNNGGMLKETGTSHWNSPNVAATNETGLTALPGGYRLKDDGSFAELGLSSYTSWSSTSDWGQNAWYFAVESINDKVYLYGYWRKCGFSVRCIKD